VGKPEPYNPASQWMALNTKYYQFKSKRKMIMENEVHICKNCGKAAKGAGHLCDPVEMKETYICEHCGQSSKDPRHICKPKLQHINFVCISCGRVAELPRQLCNPRDIVLMAKGEPPTKII
jgi:predicted RNA-binding Zn-ribbon protein involved in translation (DUF1610 family)